MRQVGAFFRLIRIGNLLMMVATQILAYYFLTHHLIVVDLLNKKFLSVLMATFLVGASGYIINDYLDIKIDYVNKPHRVIVGTDISRRTAMFFHLTFNVLAFALGLFINIYVAISIVICSALLWLYSVVYKKSYLTGNLLISSLSAYVILLLLLFDHSMSIYLVWVYALFAFISTLIREILKDMEDMKGDAKYRSRTMPIVIGIRPTKNFLIYISIFFVVAILTHLFLGNSFIPYNHHYTAILYIGYMLLFVILPLAVFIYMLAFSDTKRQYGNLSLMMKLIMLTGMLSMVLLKI
jgi:4-hydroxybenzoate polyprenyltransferase